MVTKRHLTEEHKRKIGEANSKKTRSPELRKRISETLKRKGIKPKKIYKEIGKNNHRWKGGDRSYWRKEAMKIKDFTKCSICKEEKKLIVHHCDGNPQNNKMFNLGIICHACHNAIHEQGKNTRFGGRSYDL